MDNDVELDIDPRKGSVYHKRMKSALPNMIKKEDPAVTNTVHRQRATKLVLILLLVPRFFFIYQISLSFFLFRPSSLGSTSRKKTCSSFDRC